jgi:ribosome-associated protein
VQYQSSQYRAAMSDDDFDDNDDLPPSKSQRKRDAQALQDLGELIVDLPGARFAQLRLPDALHEAVRAARAIAQRGARKRQLQYIGKLMRSIDVAPIRQQLETFTTADRAVTQRQHQIEEWRDRLLAEGDTALDELMQRHPAADRQHLRQLVRNALRERQANQAPRSQRLMFQYLRELLESN